MLRAFSGGVRPSSLVLPPSSLLFRLFYLLVEIRDAREVRTGPIFLFLREKLTSKSKTKKRSNVSDGRRGARHAAPGRLHPPPRPSAAERFLSQMRGNRAARKVPRSRHWGALRDGGGVQDAEGKRGKRKRGRGAESGSRYRFLLLSFFSPFSPKIQEHAVLVYGSAGLFLSTHDLPARV